MRLQKYTDMRKSFLHSGSIQNIRGTHTGKDKTGGKITRNQEAGIPEEQLCGADYNGDTLKQC